MKLTYKNRNNLYKQKKSMSVKKQNFSISLSDTADFSSLYLHQFNCSFTKLTPWCQPGDG